MIIYLGQPLPAGSSDPPESTTGSRIAFVSVLLQMEFTCARSVTTTAVVSYTAFPPLPPKEAVYFCCTGLGVTSTGRYPASCPVKPGLSSPASSRYRSSDHLSYSQLSYSSIVFFLCLWGKFKKLRFCSEGSESHRRALQMRIWEKILCSWACAA